MVKNSYSIIMAFKVKHWAGKDQILQLSNIGKRLITFKRQLCTEESSDYRAWRRQFLRDRLWLGLWIALPCFLTVAANNIYLFVFNTSRIRVDVAKIYGDPLISDRFRDATLASCLLLMVLLIICMMLYRTAWSKRYPAALFLIFSWSLTLTDHIVGTIFQIPVTPNQFEFMAQAVLIPVHWRLHLISQIAPILYYLVGYRLIGLTSIGDRSIYDLYAVGHIVYLFWVCLICDLAVFLYERLKRSEFETQRQLRVFLHSVSHDLRTPVMGTSIVFQQLLKRSNADITISRSTAERLLEGSERQLHLINSLLEAHEREAEIPTLHCQPLQLSSLVDAVLSDLEPALTRNQITVLNQVSSQLPQVNADAKQLWRVYCNLVTNALKHNPHGITLTLAAEVVTTRPERHGRRSPSSLSTAVFSTAPMLRCTVQDNGVGIEPSQSQQLFELYTRGPRARYMPGLGLGLYLCRRIINAHGGEIGVVSHPGQGSQFWFTLKCVSYINPS